MDCGDWRTVMAALWDRERLGLGQVVHTEGRHTQAGERGCSHLFPSRGDLFLRARCRPLMVTRKYYMVDLECIADSRPLRSAVEGSGTSKRLGEAGREP